jgi:hypothetical protein
MIHSIFLLKIWMSPTTSETSQARELSKQLRVWAESAGFHLAPPKTFIPASTVVAAARRAIGFPGEHTDAYFTAAVLRSMHEVCGAKVERSRRPFARASGVMAVYWGVTSSELPAAPLEQVQSEATPLHTNKKERRQARRQAKGLADPDPDRCRIVDGREDGSHFTRYIDEFLSLRAPPPTPPSAIRCTPALTWISFPTFCQVLHPRCSSFASSQMPRSCPNHLHASTRAPPLAHPCATPQPTIADWRVLLPRRARDEACLPTRPSPTPARDRADTIYITHASASPLAPLRVREHLGGLLSPSDPSVLVLAVGDGLTPRTAALFAFRTRWRAISIDPLMRTTTDWAAAVARLTAIRATIADAAPPGGFAADKVCGLGHAHLRRPLVCPPRPCPPSAPHPAGTGAAGAATRARVPGRVPSTRVLDERALRSRAPLLQLVRHERCRHATRRCTRLFSCLPAPHGTSLAVGGGRCAATRCAAANAQP